MFPLRRLSPRVSAALLCRPLPSTPSLHTPFSAPTPSFHQRQSSGLTASTSAVPNSAAAAEVPTGEASEPPQNRLLLVDAMGTLYRSHHALRDRLVTQDGLDTTVVYGFMTQLATFLEMRPAFTHMAIVLDAPGKTFRHEMYMDYKATRQSTPEEVPAAVPYVKQILSDLGLTCVAIPGIEADDSIGTLAARASREGYDVAIASGDKDLFQLLAMDRIRLLRPGLRGGVTEYGRAEFQKAFQDLHPSRFVDLLALMGDASDNVPGVKGIGEKRALALALEGDIETLIASAATLGPKAAREALTSEEGQLAARLSKKLVTVRTDCDVDVPLLRFPLESLRIRRPADGGEKALRLMETLELNRGLKRIQAWIQGL